MTQIICKDLALGYDGNIVCDVCSYNYGHEHIFNTEEWITDETHHWHAPTCQHNGESCANNESVKADYEKHTDINQDFRCDECLASYEDLDTDIPDYDDDDVIIMPPHIIG